MENQEWTLRSIEIKQETWGENKGKYVGEIRYSNGKDQFTFSLNPTLARVYLDLIKDTVVASANQLGENLSKSLNKIDQDEKALSGKGIIEVGEGGFGVPNGTTTSSTFMMHNFQEGEGTSKTKCKICGQEKFMHGHISHT
jgi:hypothetical protein